LSKTAPKKEKKIILFMDASKNCQAPFKPLQSLYTSGKS
jgi:hypothetical protein